MESSPPAAQTAIETITERVYPLDWGNDLAQKLTHFKKEGMPGLARLRPEDLFRMREMYLGGASYREIAMTFNQTLPLILFLSEREGWYKEKIEKAEMIAETLSQNYSYIMADSTLFITELLIFWQGYYREQIKEYKRTKDKNIIENMDLKILEKYLKLLDLLGKPVDPKDPKDKSPLVNINMNSGSVTENKGTLTITPEQAEEIDSSKIFAVLAELKRQKDAAGNK